MHNALLHVELLRFATNMGTEGASPGRVPVVVPIISVMAGMVVWLIVGFCEILNDPLVVVAGERRGEGWR